jgi:hypothetical protein
MPKLRPLDAIEQRVVGALVEKELSTPDLYPLTLNALLAACSQSSNRDPVMSLAAEQVEQTLHALMGELLVWRERGARTLRWKHQLDVKLGLDEAGKAVLAELLLRGEQTPGELRGRCSRMHPFGGLGEVEGVLTELAARALVEELPRSPGQKERRWRHRLGEGLEGRGGAEEPPERHLRVAERPSEATSAARAASSAATEVRAPSAATSSFDPAPRREGPPATAAARSLAPEPAPAEVDELRSRVAVLERRVEELARRLERLDG